MCLFDTYRQQESEGQRQRRHRHRLTTGVPGWVLQEIILTTVHALDPIANQAVADQTSGDGDGDSDSDGGEGVDDDDNEAVGVQSAIVGLGASRLVV